MWLRLVRLASCGYTYVVPVTLRSNYRYTWVSLTITFTITLTVTRVVTRKDTLKITLKFKIAVTLRLEVTLRSRV